MNLKSRIINSNTISIINYGDGFKYLFLAVILSLFVTIFDIKTISLVPGLINSISNKNLNNGAFKFILIALLSGLFRIILAYISSKINTIISSNISNKIINDTELADIYELERFGVSKLSQVFSNDIQTITNELIYPILQIITSIILSISITIFLIIKIPIITITISIIYILLYYLFIKSSKSKIRKNSTKSAYIRAKFVQSASEIIINARYLKNSSKGKKVIRFLKSKDLELKKISAQNNFLSIYPKYIAESFGLLSIAFIGLISSSIGDNQTLSILGILALSIQKLIPSFQSIFVAISAINCNSANIKRMNDLILLSTKKNSLNKNLKIFERIGNINKVKTSDKNSLALIRVNVVSNINKEYLNFELLNNQWTGLIGASGSGKTSFIDLITGLAFPLKLKNSFDTIKGNLIIEKEKNLNFIYLSQFNYIPNCPIIEYIANSNNQKYLNQNINYILKIFKFIGLFEEFEFEKVDDLYNNLAENGTSISGGQAQRLNILRTIFEIKSISKKGYNILAMDEPFKGLDENTKQKCILLLKKVSKTSLLITHSDEEAINLCESIYKIV
tara:strand:+ start:1355 stop:3049 length:1695 start_codon:yes stop_codon:yes gene_type:complete